jgi:hypothetical protein
LYAFLNYPMRAPHATHLNFINWITQIRSFNTGYEVPEYVISPFFCFFR